MIWIALIAVAVIAAGAWFGAKTTTSRVVIAVAGVVGIAGYWFIGRPGMPDAPLETRLVELKERAQTAPEEIDGAQFMAILREQARQSPDDPAPHKAMGDVYAAVGSVDEAMMSYRSALRRNPGYTPALDAISELNFLISGEVDRATLQRMPEIRERARTAPTSLTSVQIVALLKERIADAPDDPMPHKIMGDVLRGAELYERAETAYREAIRLDPGFQDALKALADMRFRVSGAIDEETAKLYREAYRLDPADLRMGYMAGIGDWQAGRRAEAEALWNRLEAQVEPGDPRGQMFQALREAFAVDAPQQ